MGTQPRERLPVIMSGSWFPVPIPGNRGTSSNRFLGTEGNQWEPHPKKKHHRSASFVANWRAVWPRLPRMRKYREVPEKTTFLAAASVLTLGN